MKKVVTMCVLAAVAMTFLIAAKKLPGKVNAPDPLAEQGKAVYAKSDCGTCHGAGGRGDGATAAGYPADHKPANFASGKWKFGGDDKAVQETISKGRPPYMPAHPQFKPDELAALSAYVRSLVKK